MSQNLWGRAKSSAYGARSASAEGHVGDAARGFLGHLGRLTVPDAASMGASTDPSRHLAQVPLDKYGAEGDWVSVFEYASGASRGATRVNRYAIRCPGLGEGEPREARQQRRASGPPGRLHVRDVGAADRAPMPDDEAPFGAVALNVLETDHRRATHSETTSPSGNACRSITCGR